MSIAYAHEVAVTAVDSPIQPTIRHFRETTQPNGLVALEKIAETIAPVVINPLIFPEQVGLVSPDYGDYYNLGIRPKSSDFESPSGIEWISCDNLKEFVDRGRAVWTNLIDKSAQITEVRLMLPGVFKPLETEPGYSRPVDDDTVMIFNNYLVSPEELDALHQVSGSTPLGVMVTSGTSKYLASSYL